MRHHGGVITLLFRVFNVHHGRHVVILLSATVAIVLAGGGLFALTQDLPFTTGLYWAITTATTVGYGDVTPYDAVGRLLASVVMLTTIPMLATVFALALITDASDGDVLVSAVILRKQAPNLPLTALTSSPSVREALRDLGVQQTVSAQELVARTLATSLETPHAGEMVAKLVESGQHLLAEVEADGETVGKALSAVRDERSGLVLGLVHDGRFTLGIGEDPVVAAGDRLLVAEPAHRR